MQMANWRSTHREEYLAYKRKWTAEHKETVAESRSRQWKKTMTKIYAAYGNRCACCGETNSLYFELDHVMNDGAAHRRAIGVGTTMVYWLVRSGFPPIVQILCANCHTAKRRGGCQHDVKMRGDVPTSLAKVIFHSIENAA